MSRRLFFMTIVAMGCCLLVIDLRHRNRQLFMELQSLQNQRDALNVETGQLLLEEGAWAEHRRVEGLARERLGMFMPLPDQLVVVYADGEGRVSVAGATTPLARTKGGR
jgi:cell division protein FtsL